VGNRAKLNFPSVGLANIVPTNCAAIDEEKQRRWVKKKQNSKEAALRPVWVLALLRLGNIQKTSAMGGRGVSTQNEKIAKRRHAPFLKSGCEREQRHKTTQGLGCRSPKTSLNWGN